MSLLLHYTVGINYLFIAMWVARRRNETFRKTAERNFVATRRYSIKSTFVVLKMSRGAVAFLRMSELGCVLSENSFKSCARIRLLLWTDVKLLYACCCKHCLSCVKCHCFCVAICYILFVCKSCKKIKMKFQKKCKICVIPWLNCCKTHVVTVATSALFER